MYNHIYAPAPGNEHSPSDSYVQLLYPQQASLSSPAQQYLHHIDELLGRSQEPYKNAPSDLVSAVFANQAAKHDLTSRHLSGLIQERTALAHRHQQDIRHRLVQATGALSIAQMLNLPDSPRRINNTERIIPDLEKQERDVQLQLWKDTLELRTQLLEERSQYHATSRRMRFLAGGSYGS